MEEKNYTSEFVGFRAELASYVFRLVTNREAVKDIVQDTYIRAFDKIDTFRGESSFKTWVFTIATNLCRNHLKTQKRWVENAQDYGANLHLKSREHWDLFHKVFNSAPDKTYEIKEHINYCFNCINKTLLPEQQVCLLLKEVYGFKVAEIMSITRLSEGKVKHAVADARGNMVRIFDDRCSFVNKKGTCHQCTELKGILNPEQNAHIKAQEIKLVKNGAAENKEYLLDLRLELVKSIDPLNASNTIINSFMLESCESWVQEGIEKKVLESSSEKEA